MININIPSCLNQRGILISWLILGLMYSGLGQSNPSSSQKPTSVTLQGKLQFESGTPVVSGLVTLLKVDSSLVKATSSDTMGDFALKNIPPGSYILQGSYDGWQTAGQTISVTDTVTNLPINITLVSDGLKLKEVLVKEKRPLFDILGDRIVLNIESNSVFGGGNAFDALGRAPRVTANAVTKSLSVDGKTGLILYQNGRQLYLPSDQIATYLQSLPANLISRIEILTSPSAQYDAGSSGVILLFTKGTNKEGFAGEISLTAGAGRYIKSNASVNLSYRSANIQGSFLYAPTYRPTYFSWRSNQVLAPTGSTPPGFAYSDEFNRIDNTSHLLRTSWDWKVSRQLTLGTVLQFAHTAGIENPTSSITYQLTPQGSLLTSLDAQTQLGQKINNLAVNVNARKQFADGQKNISVDVDGARYTNESESSAIFFQRLPALQQPENLRIYYPNEVIIRTAKLDYKSPFTLKGQFESGIKYSWISMTNQPTLTTFTPYFNALTSLLAKPYQYQEQTASAYGNLAYSLVRWSFQAGLRLEHTRYEGLSGNAAPINRDYTNLFPSASVQFTSNRKSQFSISFNRRIIRPSFDQLNPAYIFYDPLTLYSGNPLLIPQLTTTLQGTYTTPKRVSLTIVYSHSRYRITEVIYRLDSLSPTTLNYNLNFDREQRVAATLSIPFRVSANWQIQGLLTAANVQYFSTFKDTPFLNKQSTATIRVNNSVKIKSWSANLNFTYRSRAIIGYLVYDPVWFIDLGLQRPLGEKATIKVAASDIFHTLIINNHGTYLNTNIGFKHRYESQQILFIYAYRLGSKKAKVVKERSFGSETEQERLRAKRN